MTISWNMDEIEDLIPTEEIISKTIDMQDEIDTKLQTRIKTIEGQQSHGLSSDVLLEGTASFYNASKTIIEKYTNVEETLDGVVTGICNATIDQNLEELEILKKEVIKQRGVFSQDKLDNLSKIENASYKLTDVIKTVALYLTVPFINPLAPTAATVWGIVVNKNNKESLKSELNEKYDGTTGVITILNEKLERIETRKVQLEGYSDNKDAWKTMEPTQTSYTPTGNGANTAAGDGQETDDENMTTKVGVNYETDENGDPVIYYDKETKEVFYKDKDGVYKEIPVVPGGVAGTLTINASTGTYYEIDINNTSANIVIDGKEYTIPIENVKDFDTTKVAHIDASGDTVITGYGDGAPISDPLKTAAEDIQTATEDASVANPTDATEDTGGFSGAGHSFGDTENHTGGGAGHKFDVLSDYTPSIEVKDSTNQTIQLYSNKADDDLYYKDSNGDMKKAIKIGQEYVINAVSYTEK